MQVFQTCTFLLDHTEVPTTRALLCMSDLLRDLISKCVQPSNKSLLASNETFTRCTKISEVCSSLDSDRGNARRIHHETGLMVPLHTNQHVQNSPFSSSLKLLNPSPVYPLDKLHQSNTLNNNAEKKSVLHSAGYSRGVVVSSVTR